MAHTLHHKHPYDDELYEGVNCIGGCPQRRTRTITAKTAEVLERVRRKRVRRLPREWLENLSRRGFVRRSKYAKDWYLTEAGWDKLHAYELRQVCKKAGINDF